MRLFVLFAIVILLCLACGQTTQTLQTVVDELHGYVKAGDENSLQAMLAAHQWPLVRGDSVLYLTHNNLGGATYLSGDMCGWKPDSLNMRSIGGSNWFYLIQRYPVDARLEYKYVFNDRYVLDSLNQITEVGGFATNSVLMMPGYVFPMEVLATRQHADMKIDTLRYKSRLLKNERQVYVYRSANVQADSPLLIFQDGGEYLTRASAGIILNNLVADGQIPPLWVVFVDPVNRMHEYWLNDDYVRMLFGELLPKIRREYRLQIDAPLGLAGASLGGLISLYALKDYAEQCDFILSQSGALWIENEQIVKELGTLDAYPGRIWLDYGSFEGTANVHGRLKELLDEKQIANKLTVYNEGHNWANWRAHLATALKYCLGGK